MTTKNTTNVGSDDADINLEKFFADWLPKSIRRCRRAIESYEEKLTKERAKLEKLVRHAAIEELDTSAESPAPVPDAVPSEPVKEEGQS